MLDETVSEYQRRVSEAFSGLAEEHGVYIKEIDAEWSILRDGNGVSTPILSDIKCLTGLCIIERKNYETVS